MGRRIAEFWERVDALDRRLARLGQPAALEERAWQTWWNEAGAPGFISSAVYGQIGLNEALACAPAYACIDVLSDAMGRTPIDVFRGAGSNRKPVDPAPPVIGAPSGVVAEDVWRYQLGFALVTDGNAFGEITSMSGSWPSTIELIDPDKVKDRKVVDGVKQVKIDNKVRRCWPNGDIWHCPGRMVQAGSPWGISPVTQSQNIVQTALEAERFALGFFRDGGHPTGMMYSTKELNKAQVDEIKAGWRRVFSAGARDIAVVGGDLKYEKIQTDPKDSQFIDTMRWCVEQISRIWRVPPAMIYGAVSGESITYANVSDADLAFLKHSLDGLYVRVETALTDILPRPQYVKYNRNAILRADVSARFTVYEIGIRNGIYNRNEIRDWEDMNPIPVNGDEYVWPPVGKGAGMDVRPPSTGGIVQETPTSTVAPAPAAPAVGNGNKPPVPAKV